MWATGAKDESLNFLRQFTDNLAHDVKSESSLQSPRPGVSKQKIAELSKLIARCYYKQGEWETESHDEWKSVSYHSIITLS
jgi:FKBP12-rapamycin complex-associated protein